MTVVYADEFSGDSSKVGDYSYRRTAKQSPVTDLPLPYKYFKGTLKRSYSPSYSVYGANITCLYRSLDQWVSGGTDYYLGLNSSATTATNRCYEKLVSSIKEDPQLLVNLAEREKSLLMISRRAKQLLTAAKYLRSGNFLGFLRTLKISKKSVKPRRGLAKSFADTWLEFHFGWVPLIHDIYSAVAVLDSNPKTRSSETSRLTGSDVFQPLFPSALDVLNTDSCSYSLVAKMGCSCRISDIAAFKANELGLINPASVVWELIPFSFVVDWFIPVGAWLSSFTDLQGLEVTRAYTTVFIRLKGHLDYSRNDGNYTRADYLGWGMKRSVGLTGPSFTLPSFSLSPTRALTAISLLTQFLNFNRGK